MITVCICIGVSVGRKRRRRRHAADADEAVRTAAARTDAGKIRIGRQQRE